MKPEVAASTAPPVTKSVRGTGVRVWLTRFLMAVSLEIATVAAG